jgi:predicted nucleic acid-binding protein
LVLVDTSIWIDYLGTRRGEGAQRLDKIMADGTPFALTPIILQEVLQGVRSDAQFIRLRRDLMTHRFLFPLYDVESYASAAAIYTRCRRVGVTPRGAVDCLIAQIAIENRATLLHNDADFNRMAQVVPELRIQ